MAKWKPISFDKVKTYSLKDRSSKVSVDDFAKPWKAGKSLNHWLDSLPDILAGEDLLKISECIVKAVKSEKMVILGMGAHPIKVGLSPVIIDLMERGVIKAVALNGAGIIHDFEIAMAGHTSEDVGSRLNDGKFGMAEETGKLLNEAIKNGADNNEGMGTAVGEMLTKGKFQYNNFSIIARACELGIPVTVHVAVGTDTIHFHPDADGAAIGKTSHIDFGIFSRLVSNLEGGVFINLGSAVVIPEVFLKAITLVRNLGYNVKDFTTVVMDFMKQYRSMTNVLDRPTQDDGQGFSIVGHHEIMFPLLSAAVIEGMERD